MSRQARAPIAPHIFEILLAVSQGPRHGYGIIADINERTGGEVSIGTSSLYAAVRQMLRDGLLEEAPPVADEQSSGPPRRYYRITDTGRDAAHREADRLRRTAEAADALLRTTQPETRS